MDHLQSNKVTVFFSLYHKAELVGHMEIEKPLPTATGLFEKQNFEIIAFKILARTWVTW